MKRFPTSIQLEARDCGPTCLHIISKYYGKSIPVQFIKGSHPIPKDGVSLLGVAEMAEKIGFETAGVKLTWEQLCNNLTCPCIVHWKQNHFVVVYRIRENRKKRFVYVSDPAIGLMRYTEEHFLKSWIEIKDSTDQLEMGIALFLEPTSYFYENNEKHIQRNHFTTKKLLDYLKPHYKKLIGVLLTMIVASVLSLLLPAITQAVVDKGVMNNNLSLVTVMLLAQLFIIIGQLINEFLRNWLMMNITIKVSISLVADFLSKVMSLPLSSFDSNSTGETLLRIQDHDRIQDFLTNSLLSIVMAFVLIIVYGSILIRYNLQVFIVFILGTMIYLFWISLFRHKRKALDNQRFVEQANNQNAIVQVVEGIHDIKLNSSEEKQQSEWVAIQNRLFKINMKSLIIMQGQQVGGTFIEQTKNVLISFLAAKSVIDGGMTIGTMMAISYILGQLNAPVTQLVSFIRESQDAGMAMDRLEEVHRQDNEEPEGVEKIQIIPKDADIEFKDVTFQYEGANPTRVIDRISLRIPHGKFTAIVGSSGSGKTTLLKLMLGFYTPTQGKVLLGGNELSRYSIANWRKKCGCVMQEGFIFNNTIAENIALGDKEPCMERIYQAASIANIEGWINKLPLKYNTLIGPEGHGLSVGQKQRILIARAAYKKAPYLFFDEATNSLDANNEKTIIDNLSSLFQDKTVVTVAHRLSTIKKADNIIVLDKGRIVESGTHQELIRNKGPYYLLVHNQLEINSPS